MNLTTTLDVLMEKVDSRYTLVVVAAKQARLLTEKRDDKYNIRKPVTEALKDIAHGKIMYRPTKQGIK
ncbi:MAG: DNA-directed RNA polymerase subunit omega [Desulfocucumaceae bacterium]